MVTRPGAPAWEMMVKTRVQHGVRNIAAFEDVAQNFAFLDADGADQHRLHAGAGFLDQRGDGMVFLGVGAIDLVILVATRHRHVGGDFHHRQFVDLGEFVGFGHGRAGHARKFRKQPEIVLEGDRGESLVFLLYGHEFFGFQGLVQAFGEAAAFHHAAGEFVDDHHLVVAHDVIDIRREQGVRAQRLLHVVHDGDIENVVEIAFGDDAGLAQHVLHALAARLGHMDGFGFLVLLVGGFVFHQLGHHQVHRAVQIRGIFGRA
jgi:hypothetical protein